MFTQCARRVDVAVTGLAWRRQVCQQVFEEAAVDLRKGLAAWSDSRSGKRKGRRVGFPRFKKKTGDIASFRLRNKHRKDGKSAIRVGDHHRASRSRCLGSGRSGCMMTPVGCGACLSRARQDLFRHRQPPRPTVVGGAERRGRRYRPEHQHPAGTDGDTGGWVGVDRGLSAFLVAARADGTEVARIADAPNALAAGMKQQRQLAKSLSRKKKGSHNRKDAAARLGRHHHRVANIRRIFCTRLPTRWSRTTTSSSSRT